MYRLEPDTLNKTEALWFNPYDTVHMTDDNKRKVAEEGVDALYFYSCMCYQSPHQLLELCLLVLYLHTHIYCIYAAACSDQLIS